MKYYPINLLLITFGLTLLPGCSPDENSGESEKSDAAGEQDTSYMLTPKQEETLAKFRGVQTEDGLSLASVPAQRQGEMADCLDSAPENEDAKDTLRGCFCLVLAPDDANIEC